MRKAIRILVLMVLFIVMNNTGKTQGVGYYFKISNGQFISGQDFSFDLSVVNTSSTQIGIQTFQFVFEMDKRFRNGGALAQAIDNTPHYVSRSDFSSDYLAVGAKVLVRSYTNPLYSDLVFLNSDLVTSGSFPIRGNSTVLIARVVLHNTVNFDRGIDPRLRFKFFSGAGGYLGLFTSVSNSNSECIFGNYTPATGITQSVNLNIGYGSSESPSGASLSVGNGTLNVNFTPLSRENRNYLGNIDTTAAILKYVGFLEDSLTGRIIRNFEGTSVPILLTNVERGTYRVKIAAVNLADTSYYSYYSGYLRYENNYFNITLQSIPGNGGTFSPSTIPPQLAGSTQSVSYGASSILYRLDSVLIDNVRNTDSLSSYTFINIQRDHILQTYYSIKQVGYKLVSNGNGAITDGVITASANTLLSSSLNYGSSRRFLFVPSANTYVVGVSVKIGNTTTTYLDSVNGITINNITDSVTIMVNFGSQYTVSAVVNGGNGTITPSLPLNVSNGGNVSYTITPSNGYEIKDILVNGISDNVPARNGTTYTYTLTNVMRSINVVVSFQAQKAYKPIITRDITSVFVTTPNSIDISVSAITNDLGRLSYKWYRKGNGESVYSIIDGATSNTIRVSSQNILDSGTKYRVIVYNTWVTALNYDSTISKEATLNILHRPLAPVITKQPVNVNVGYGKNVQFSVTADRKSVV